MDVVLVYQEFLVIMKSGRVPFDSLLVVTLLGVLKKPIEPVRWLIYVSASPGRTC